MIGFYHWRKIKTDVDFYSLNFGKSLPTILICTIFATAIGGGTIMGYVNEIYKNPLILIFIITQPLYWIITSKVLLSGIDRIKDCKTLTQIMNRFYGKPGKIIGLYAVLIESIGASSMQIIAFGLICEYFFQLNFLSGVLIGIVVINIYSLLAGLRGIITIDIMQFLIFFIVIPASYVVMIKNSNFDDHFINTISFSKFNVEFNFVIIITLLIQSLLPEFAAPLTQRYMMLAHDKNALKLVFKKLFMITTPFMFSLCLIAYLIIINSERNVLLSTNVVFDYIDWLPLGIKGLMISGLFAVIMSTADSFINATSDIIINDFLKQYLPKTKPKHLLLLTRIIIILLLLFSFLFIIYKDVLLYLVFILKGFGANTLIIPLSAALLGFSITKKQFLISFFLSAFFVICNILFFKEYTYTISLLGFLGSFLGLLLNKKFFNYIKKINELHLWFYKKIVNMISIINGFYSKYQFIKSNRIYNPIKNVKSIIPPNFSIFILSYYFVFSLYIGSDNSYLTYLMVVGYALILLLLIRDVLFTEKFLNKYSHLFFYFCITFCLPFLSSYMLFYYVDSKQGDYIWVINSLLTTFLLYQFLNASAFLISMSIGFICGCALYMYEHQSINFGYPAQLVFYVYLSFLFISQTIARDKEKELKMKENIQEDKFKMVQTFGEMMAHELKNPVTILKSQAEMFQVIIDNTKKINDKETEKYVINSDDYQIFNFGNKMSLEVSQHGINTIDNLLTSLRGPSKGHTSIATLISTIVNAAIKECSLAYPEAQDIQLDLEDFQVKYNFHNLKHVIINLIKNAYAHNGRNVEIEIKSKDNVLYFIDYGIGISEKIINKIFDKFFTNNRNGTGLGLSYCKLIMSDINGSIKCESIEGKYTKFILKFPKVNY
jgi:Na+/proline symporter